MSLKYLEIENAINIPKMKKVTLVFAIARRCLDVYRCIIAENNMRLLSKYRRLVVFMGL